MHRHHRSFTLIETLVAAGITLFVLTLVSILLLRNLRSYGEGLEVDGVMYYRMPNANVARDATSIFMRMRRTLDTCNAVWVLGGAREDPLNLHLGYPPVSMSYIQPNHYLGWDIAKWWFVRPADLQYSYGFRNYATNVLSMPFETSFNNSDFTVIGITAPNQTSTISVWLQVRKFSMTASDGVVYNFYRVLYRVGNNVWNYAYYLPALADQWAKEPGAYHSWYRVDTAWNRIEEAPCEVILPDPEAYAGVGLATGVKPVSRFIFQIPVFR